VICGAALGVPSGVNRGDLIEVSIASTKRYFALRWPLLPKERSLCCQRDEGAAGGWHCCRIKM
jgi:hypothetical protein